MQTLRFTDKIFQSVDGVFMIFVYFISKLLIEHIQFIFIQLHCNFILLIYKIEFIDGTKSFFPCKLKFAKSV